MNYLPFHNPGQIPVGDETPSYDIHHGFVGLDFGAPVAAAGDEQGSFFDDSVIAGSDGACGNDRVVSGSGD
jgi:hypothetical protein